MSDRPDPGVYVDGDDDHTRITVVPTPVDGVSEPQDTPGQREIGDQWGADDE